MTGSERRNEIISLLKQSQHPITGAAIASRFGVSRQVIVQDIALLRAGSHNIISTTKGYILL